MAKRFSDAEDHFITAYEGYRKILGEEHPFTQESLQLLVVLFEAWGKPEKAAEYRAMLVEVVEQPAKEDQ